MTFRYPMLGAVLLSLLVCGLVSVSAPAQDLHPSRRASPLGIASTHLGDTYVKVTYGRPYVRNREIFGANTDTSEFLVPYGELWRTGANEATEITATGPLVVAGQQLPAGTYSIFTIPGAETWSIHFSPHLGLDGTGIFDASTNTFTQVYDPADDVVAVTVPRTALQEPVDQFTIDFEGEGSSADMVLRWELTEVRIPVSTP